MSAPSLAWLDNDPRFHKTFQVPADPASGRPDPFHLQYADYGYRNEENPQEENVILFFGTLVGSRVIHATQDAVAKRAKVRVINADKPGIGGTDVVESRRSLEVFRDIISALLTHLQIPYVTVASHCAGTVYALDFMIHHPEHLHPKTPYLAIGAPWIIPTHTTSMSLAVAQALPVSLIGTIDWISAFSYKHFRPLVGLSQGISQLGVPKQPLSQEEIEGPDGKDIAFEEEMFESIVDLAFKNGVRGMSTEAVLLLQRAEGVSGWSDWGDYDTCVPRLAETMRATGRKLQVNVFFAEHDVMIGDAGTKGPLWFDKCWDIPSCEGVIQYSSTTIKAADHDRVWNLRLRVPQMVFERVIERRT